MTNRQISLTNKICQKLEGPPPHSTAKAYEYTDTATGVKFTVSKTDARTWLYRYTFQGNKRSFTIGSFPGIQLDEARETAIRYGAMLDRGIDPQSQRDAMKKMPTFGEFAMEEYLPYAYKHKRSADMDESKLRLHILKKFGHRRLCDISRYDVDMYRTSIAQSLSKATSNRHLALLSRIFSLAITWQRVESLSNPCSGLKKLQESSDIGRALKPDEIGRLQMALLAEANVMGAKALLLLMYSGLRHAEVLTLPWSAVDLAEGTIYLSHTKSGRARLVTLNPMAIDLLNSIERQGSSPWVFPGKDPKKPMNNIKKVWTRALADAKVKPARIHDLRHSFASAAARAGVSLYAIQRMLGHQTSQTTMRYASLSDAVAMREASAAAVSRLAGY